MGVTAAPIVSATTAATGKAATAAPADMATAAAAAKPAAVKTCAPSKALAAAALATASYVATIATPSGATATVDRAAGNRRFSAATTTADVSAFPADGALVDPGAAVAPKGPHLAVAAIGIGTCATTAARNNERVSSPCS